MAKQTKITVETDSLFVLRGRTIFRAWCPQCDAESDVIPFDSIAVVSNLPPTELENWFESEAIHRSKALDGTSSICLSSLLRRFQKTATSKNSTQP